MQVIKRFIDNSYSLDPHDYITYYLKPDYAIDNKDNISIANSLAYIYKPMFKRINSINFKETKIELPKQIYYTIILKKNAAKFYITMPKSHSSMIKSKMATVWPKAELRTEELPPILNVGGNIQVGELIQRDYSFKSLQCSTNDLYPLTNMLGIIRSLRDDEEVRVNIIIEPFGKMNWVEKSKYQLEDFKQGKEKDVVRSNGEKAFNTAIDILDKGVDIFLDIQNTFLEMTMGLLMMDSPKEKKKKEISININDCMKENRLAELSSYTHYKFNSEVFKARIIITAQGKDTSKNKLNIMHIANSYRDLQGDNELILMMKKDKEATKEVINLNSKLVRVSKNNIFSDKEIAKFIQLPQKDLQREYSLDRIDTREVSIPKELQDGKVRIGIVEQQGVSTVSTFNDNYNVVPRTTVVVGPQGSGKTTILKRIGSDNYKAGYSNFILDYVENCETAREVAAEIPDKDKVIYEVGARESNLSLAFNEVSKLIKEDMDVWTRIRYANLLAEQLELLLNAITTEGITELTAPMLRYLHAASMVTFIRPGAVINDVFKVVKNHKVRAEAVAYAKHTRVFRLDDEVFSDLAELDKIEKGKVVGTRTDLTVGIENRITMLLKNPDIKEMLCNEVNPDDDFTKYIEEGKTIVIIIPQNRFPNAVIRDVLAVYYFSRLWLTVQLRTNNKHARLCNVIIDEIGRIETLSKFVGAYCTEFRRHHLGLTIAAHHLEQLKGLLKQLTSSGASYMLLAGIEKKNIKALEEEIKPFTLEDVLNLKTHTSLNIINYGNQYARFIAKQPVS